MPVHTYRVAQRLLTIDPALPEMAERRVDDLAVQLAKPGTDCGLSTESESVFHGDGQLGSVQRHIECCWSRRGYSLRVDGVGQFRITGDGRHISRSRGSRSQGATSAVASPPQLTETVLGPAMTLALALQDVWCLHAAAVEYQGEVSAFLGTSGAGKSTLGRELPRLDPRLRCAADDVLPVTLEDGTVQALPRFPQLKYQLDRQPGDVLPASLPLRRIHVLKPQAPSATSPAEVATEPLIGTAAVLALVRHTVAAKLFTKDLLKRHMDFCVHLAERVEISRLCYPHRPEALDRAREILFPQTA